MPFSFNQLEKEVSGVKKTVGDAATVGQDVVKTVDDVTKEINNIKSVFSKTSPTNGTAGNDRSMDQTIRIQLEVRVAKNGAFDTESGEYELHGRIYGKQLQRIADKNELLAQKIKRKIDEIISQALNAPDVQSGKKPR